MGNEWESIDEMLERLRGEVTDLRDEVEKKDACIAALKEELAALKKEPAHD